MCSGTFSSLRHQRRTKNFQNHPYYGFRLPKGVQMGPSDHFGILKLHFWTKSQSRIWGKEGILRNLSREALRPTQSPLASTTGDDILSQITLLMVLGSRGVSEWAFRDVLPLQKCTFASKREAESSRRKEFWVKSLSSGSVKHARRESNIISPFFMI